MIWRMLNRDRKPIHFADMHDSMNAVEKLCISRFPNYYLAFISIFQFFNEKWVKSLLCISCCYNNDKETQKLY